MKIQNHSVINKWGDPYYVYILPIFPLGIIRLRRRGRVMFSTWEFKTEYFSVVNVKIFPLFCCTNSYVDLFCVRYCVIIICFD